MPQNEDDDLNEIPPPTPGRVAKRALILAAVSCRGVIENDPDAEGAEGLRGRLLPWLDAVGASTELEDRERQLLSAPIGSLDPKTARDAGWHSEGMAALAWALDYIELPDFYEQCDPAETAAKMGFLRDLDETPLTKPFLQSAEQIGTLADSYLTVHWRLREQTLRPRHMDFVDFVANCNWGPLHLEGVEIVERDLAVRGTPINQLDENQLREALSITRERHQALNWLIGYEELYSKVTTDT
jgi:hypothetical protein